MIFGYLYATHIGLLIFAVLFFLPLVLFILRLFGIDVADKKVRHSYSHISTPADNLEII